MTPITLLPASLLHFRRGSTGKREGGRGPPSCSAVILLRSGCRVAVAGMQAHRPAVRSVVDFIG